LAAPGPPAFSRREWGRRRRTREALELIAEHFIATGSAGPSARVLAMTPPGKVTPRKEPSMEMALKKAQRRSQVRTGRSLGSGWKARVREST
jgi:hypothetical protein